MIRPPPRSSLFPYTPLSRSVVRLGDVERELGALRRELDVGRPAPRRCGADATGDAAAGEERLREAEPQRPLVLRDRKSTRLNSSHANISYAVFCLKKKKI